MIEKSIKKNAVYNAIKTVSAIIFPLITFPYISRVLQVDNIGKINFGSSIISYFSLIASLGISTYAIRECATVATDRKRLSILASQIFSINVFTTIFSYILLIITLLFYSKIRNYRLIIILQSIPIITTTLGTDWINSAEEDFKYISIRTLAFQILSLILMFLFVKNENDYIKYVIISVIANSGANIINIFYRKRYCDIRLLFDDIEWKRHFAPITYMFVMILAQTVYNNIDISMLGIMKGDFEVGIYSTAHKISNTLEVLVTSILWVVLPRMSYYFANKKYDEINLLLTKVFNFTLTIGLPVILGIIMLSDDCIMLFAGKSYIRASIVLRILSAGSFITFFGGSMLGNMLLLPAKREKYMMFCCVVMSIFNVIANYIIIPMFGANGAAFTTFLCTIISAILAFIRIDKNIRLIKPMQIIYKPFLGSILIFIICYFCRYISYIYIRVFASIVLSAIIYFIIQELLKNTIVTQFTNAIINKTKIINSIFK